MLQTVRSRQTHRDRRTGGILVLVGFPLSGDEMSCKKCVVREGLRRPLPTQLHPGPHTSYPTYLIQISMMGRLRATNCMLALPLTRKFHQAGPHSHLWECPSLGAPPAPSQPSPPSLAAFLTVPPFPKSYICSFGGFWNVLRLQGRAASGWTLHLCPTVGVNHPC